MNAETICFCYYLKEGVRIAENDAELESMNNNNESQGELEELFKKCRALITGPESCTLKITAIDFEKDDECNWHIDYITAASNNRAMNYCIELADKFKVAAYFLFISSYFALDSH